MLARYSLKSVLRGCLAVGRWTCDLQVAGSITLTTLAQCSQNGYTNSMPRWLPTLGQWRSGLSERVPEIQKLKMVS